jgi:hypothetical protein
MNIIDGSGDIEIEFVCVHHYNAPKNTSPEAAATLWQKLKAIPNLCIYKQDFTEEANHEAMCAIIRIDDDGYTLKKVIAAAAKCGVEIDCIDRNTHLQDIDRGLLPNVTEVIFTASSLREPFEQRFSGKLYHATAEDNAESCLRDGVTPTSYWATEDLIDYYVESVEDDGHEAVVLAVDLSELDEALLEPDYPGIEEPVVFSAMGKRDQQVWQEWEASTKTWRDSLEIIGSIRYRGVVKPHIEDY